MTRAAEADGRRGIASVTVAVLLPTSVAGGHEYMLLEWLQRARARGLRVTVCCGPGAEISQLLDRCGMPCEDARYVVDKKGTLRWAQWLNFARTLSLVGKLPREVIVLLAPGAMQFGLVHVLACALQRRAIVCYVPITHSAVTLRLKWPSLRDWIARRLASRVAMWITVTDEQRLRLKDYWRIRAPVHVIPNRISAVSLAPILPETRVRQQGCFTALYAGRFDQNQKGLDWLAVLVERERWLPEIRFVFQGRGEFSNRLQAMSRRLGTDRAQVVPWGNLAQAFASADVLLLPSRFEGLPLVAIEAIWAGIPVIATLESGLLEVLPPESLFAFGDVAGLERALDYVRSGDHRREIVDYARRNLAALLSEERYVGGLNAVLDGLICVQVGTRACA